jgi:actin
LFQKLALKAAPLLAIYNSGRTSGVVLECGAGATHAFPVYEGAPVTTAIQSIAFGGHDVTESFEQALTQRSTLPLDREREIAIAIKMKFGQVALDFEAETKSASETMEQYELPDGQKVDVGVERFRGPEIMFNPELFYEKKDGIHKMIHSAILGCSEETQKELYKSIILSGGNSIFPGLASRLRKEVSSLAPDTTIKIVSPEDRQFSVFNGASIFCSAASSNSSFITKDQFEEAGSSIVHRFQFD